MNEWYWPQSSLIGYSVKHLQVTVIVLKFILSLTLSGQSCTLLWIMQENCAPQISFMKKLCQVGGNLTVIVLPPFKSYVLNVSHKLTVQGKRFRIGSIVLFEIPVRLNNCTLLYTKHNCFVGNNLLRKVCLFST